MATPIQSLQSEVDQWIQDFGVRYFNELTNMAQLTEELTTTENKIAFARQNYNDQVNNYQTYKQTFPPVVIANSFNFKDSAYLDLGDDEKSHKRANIEVSFGDDGPTTDG